LYIACANYPVEVEGYYSKVL